MSIYFGGVGPDGSSFDEFLARYLQSQQAAQAARSSDITRLLSRRTHALLNRAAQFAIEHGHSDVDALHILRVLVELPPAAAMILRAGADPAAIAAALEQRLPVSTSDIPDSLPALTPAAQRALFDAYQVARASGASYIDPEHLFFAMLLNPESPAGQVLAAAGITPQTLQAGAYAPTAHSAGATGAARASGAPGSPDAVGPAGVGEPERAGAASGTRPAASDASSTPMLDQYGTDLTALARRGELDPVVGRADEIEQTIEILSRRTKNNPVLIGEAGVGKTAIVEGLARAIVAGEVPEQLRATRVVSLQLSTMLAGTRFRGDFEERLTKTLDEIGAHKGELIVFLDELHTVVGTGGGGDSGMDAGNILKPRLARGELHVIGATTLKEYRAVEKDTALERRFQPVRVGEPSIEDAVLILNGLRGAYELYHGVRYTDAAIRAAVELSARYIPDRFLPDKAIDLIDQAGARLRLKRGADAAASDVAVGGSVEVGEAAAGGAVAGEAVIGEAEIAEIIARATGIPASRLTEGDRERLAHLEEDLHRRVVGQDDAVARVAKAVRRNRTGMGDERRPVGSFLFLGPTGVGKTELAKALAESLFGSENALVRFDMSEFGERHTVSRLVGAPPGYVGYDEAGQLTERVRRNPYSVVLLDEMEKAHPDVFNLLLQVLDDGRLTDGQGRTVDFRNTVVIMTSNLGSEFLASRSGTTGFTANPDDSGGAGVDKVLSEKVMATLRESMRPEFLNRIDEIVLFGRLQATQLHEIVRMLLAFTESRLRAQGIGFTASDEAVDWIAAHGYEPEYGARPLRRLIQRELDDRIADLLVTSELRDGGRIVVSVVGGELVVGAGA